MRKHTLVELNPVFCSYYYDNADKKDAIRFDCPEGHEGCSIRIRFSPALDGSSTKPQRNGAIWTRVGEDFASLSLQPSIRNTPVFASMEDAIARGAIPEHITPSLLCAFHGYITSGRIEFCADSR